MSLLFNFLDLLPILLQSQLFEFTEYKYPFCIQSCFSSGQSQPADDVTASFMLNGYKTPGKKLLGNKRPALLIHSVLSMYTALSAR